MSFEDEFEEMMGDEVTREVFVTDDSFGQSTFGVVSKVKCHIVFKPTMTRTAAGRSEVDQSVREVVSTAQIYCANVGWTVKDRVTMPDGSTPIILTVITRSDGDGSHHQVVMV